MASSSFWTADVSQSFFEGIAQVGFEFDVLTSRRWSCRQHVVLPSPGQPQWLPEAVSTSLLVLLVAASRSLADPSQEIPEHVSSPLRLMKLHLVQEKWLSPKEHGESPYPQRWFQVSYAVDTDLPILLRGKTSAALSELAQARRRSQDALLADELFPQGLLCAAGLADPRPRRGTKKPPLDRSANDFEQWLLRTAQNDVRRNLVQWAPDGPHGAKSLSLEHDLALLPTDTPAPETLVEIQDLLHALNTLASPRERQVMDLRLSGVSPADIARQLSIPRPQVDVYVYRLREKLARLKAG